MTDKTYKCEECDKEIPISWVRIQLLIDTSYDLQRKNKKLLYFIRDFHKNPSDEFIIKARDLLKELGELE